MPVKLLSSTINTLVGLLKAAVESRAKKLDLHAVQAERLLKRQRRDYELARKALELKQADKAIGLYKSLDEAKKALAGIK